MKIKKNYFYVGIIIVVIVLSIIAFYLIPPIKQTKKTEENQKTNQNEIKEEDRNPFSVDKNGYLSYPLDRGDVRFKREDYGIEGNLSIHNVIYQSKYGNIYGLLVLPTTAEEVLPGIVLLPGAGVPKESKIELAKKIALLDTAVLVIDQRRVGETDGILPNLDDDYTSFLADKEPYQYLMVYDALRAYDLLKSAPFTDSDRIIIIGESLGGRIAVIAAALDRNIEGALAISTSGLDFKPKGDANKDKFLLSIDSDHYIDLITPRKLVMMHNANDNIVPLSSAVKSYSKAQEPKQFVLVNDTTCNHGYCDSMWNGLAESLDYLIDTSSRTLISVPVK